MGFRALESENEALKEEVRVLRECLTILCKASLSILHIYEITDERLTQLRDLLNKCLKLKGGTL